MLEPFCFLCTCLCVIDHVHLMPDGFKQVFCFLRIAGRPWWSIIMLCLMGTLRSIGRTMSKHGSISQHGRHGDGMVIINSTQSSLFSPDALFAIFCYLYCFLNCFFEMWNVSISSSTKEGCEDFSKAYIWTSETYCSWTNFEVQYES